MTEIKELQAKPDSGVIKILEELLELAKSGDIQQIMCVNIHHSGKTSSHWSVDIKDANRIIGEIMLATVTYNNQTHGIRSEDINHD